VHILFLSHYFPPEVNAPASRTYEHCVRWAQAGHDVTVLTCQPNCPDGIIYPGYKNSFRRQVEFVDGVRIVRVWTYLAANTGTVRRISNYLSYMLSAILASIRLPRPDVVVATSPQFFCGWAGVWVARLKRVPLVLEIRDIWPESIRITGAIKNGLVLRLLEYMEQWMYQGAHHIVAVGNGYRANITEKVDMSDRISVITNGVDVRKFVSHEPDPQLRRSWGMANKFVCAYIGTIGMAHGLQVVVKAAEILRRKGRTDIGFLLVGDGSLRGRLADEVKQAGLDEMVVFAGRKPREQIPAILGSSDACLIHLKSCQLFTTVIPSKIFEALAMGRPIIMGVKGESRRIVMEAGAGLEMEPDSPDSLALAVETLADNATLRSQLGRAARGFVAQHYDRNVLANKYLDLLECIADGGEAIKLTQPAAGQDMRSPDRKAA